MAELWPGALISVLALDLTIDAAYFPPRFHRYFKPRENVMPWQAPSSFTAALMPVGSALLLSGTVEFLERILGELVHIQRVIVSVDLPRRGISPKSHREGRAKAQALLRTFGIRPVFFLDADNGGATDACHVFGFGHDLCSSILPASDRGLARTVRHFLDGGTGGRFLNSQKVLKSTIPELLDSPRKVLWHDDVVLATGLFPCLVPGARVYCPSHFFPTMWIARPLSTIELLRLYQLPLSLDVWLGGFEPARGLPFEDSPAPDLFTSIFRQLWGVVEGGLDLNLTLEEGEGEELELTSGTSEGAMTVSTRPDVYLSDTKAFTDDSKEEEEEELDLAPCKASKDDVKLPNCGGWQFDFGDGFGGGPGENYADPLTDEDTVTSCASEETLRGCGGVEKHERGGPIVLRAGPPFTVGDVIRADVGKHGLQRAFVLRADHPRYQLRLEDGTTIGTSTHEAWLQPGYATGRGNPNGFAPDQDDPFFEIRQTIVASRSRGGKIGSYGVLGDAQLESLRRIEEAKEYAKAVKADDADIPVHLWNDRVKAPGTSKENRDAALTGLRKLGLRLFLRGLVRDCVAHMREAHGLEWMKKPRQHRDGLLTELGKDQSAIANLLWHSTHTNWFEFHAGSRLVHLRFPQRYRRMARDGVPAWFTKPGPTTKGTQPPITDSRLREKTREKIGKVLKRRYLISTGLAIKSFIKFFAVPKGEDDIRMVYDATANKLNECVWVPSFWLPTIDSLVRALDKNSWMTDRDVGDMFLNFQLHKDVVPFTGVDLSSLYDNSEELGPRWAVWDRNLMGFAASPYNSIKMALVAEEICKGDRFETGVGWDGKELNPFQWKRIQLNLPGTRGYDPCVTWISKRREDGRIACDVFTFVDDERVVGPDEELTWQASHALASKQSYLGIQDAARKARPCSQTTGAWAGSIVHVLEGLGVCVLTSKEKWAKMREILAKWSARLLETAPKLSHKELLSDRGFLVYVTRTYPAMVPYLKGFHLTIEMWRGGRDADGWKLKGGDDSSVTSLSSLGSLDVTRAGAHGLDLGMAASYSANGGEDEDEAAANHRLAIKLGEEHVYAPEDGFTTPVPRFKDDINALLRLSNFDLPPLRVVRPSHVVHVYYGFGDASGKQFGATISANYNCRGCLSRPTKGKRGIRFRVGLWSAREEDESSNYKELCNLVETVAGEARAGRLRDCEFFIFTDNSTAESCYYRGNSKSRRLHSLVLDLRALEMEFGMTIHVIHVSGKRMIAQGTDGCSRGSLMEGVMAGEDMLTFVDLSRSALERCPRLLRWVRSWTSQPLLEPLTPEGWFEEGHGVTGGVLDRHNVWMPTHCKRDRMFLWAPPPAVADAALEELLKARHKRTDLFHVVVIPRLMTPRWRRLFNKSCDFSFVVSPGSSFWPDDMFEPLWVGIVLPFSPCRPWSLKRAPLLVEMGRDLRALLETSEADAGNLLRKLLLLPKRLATLSEHVACGVLHIPRAGDHQVPNCGDEGCVWKPMAQGRGTSKTDVVGS